MPYNPFQDKPWSPFGGGGASTPLPFFDTFDRADGAISNSWIGVTWTISGNKALNTPVGTSLITNGDFTTWVAGVPTGWVLYGNVSPNKEVTEVAPTVGHGGGGNGAANIFADASSVGLRSAAFASNAMAWLRLQFSETKKIAGNINANIGYDVIRTAAGTHIQTYPGGTTILGIYSSGACDVTIDDVSLIEIPVSELVATRNYQTADNRVAVDVLRNANNWQAGVCVVDDPTNPQNGLLLYLNIARSGGTNQFILDKIVAGVRSNVFTEIASILNNDYSVPQTIILQKDGSTVTCRFGVYRQTASTFQQYTKIVTVADAGVVAARQCGIFSPDQNITFDNFSIYPDSRVHTAFWVGDSKLTQLYNDCPGYFTSDFYAFDEVPRYATSSILIAGVRAGIDAKLATLTIETPEFVFMNVGVNDANATPVTDETQFKIDYQYVLDAIHTKWPTTPIYIMAGVYRTSKPAECATVSGWIRTVMDANPTFCREWADEIVWYAPNMALYSSDDVHYSVAGCQEAARLGRVASGYS